MSHVRLAQMAQELWHDTIHSKRSADALAYAQSTLAERWKFVEGMQDPLQWLYKHKETFGAPAETLFLSTLLGAVCLVMFVVVMCFGRPVRGRGIIGKAFASLLISVLMAATIFLLFASMMAGVSTVMSFQNNAGNWKDANMVMAMIYKPVAGMAISVILAGVTFAFFGAAVAMSYAPTPSVSSSSHHHKK